MSRSTSTCLIYKKRVNRVTAVHTAGTHLIHLLQRLLAHPLERTDLPSLLSSSEIDITEPSLADLRDDVELVDSQTRPSSPQNHTLASTVRFPLLGIFSVRESPRRRVFVESFSTFLARRKISKHLEVVI